MTSRIQVGNLQVAPVLFELINEQIIPGTGIDSDRFWTKLEALVDELGPKNRALLEKRDELQQQIDQWHLTHKYEPEAYKAFLTKIGYLVPEGKDFSVSTANVDIEIAEQAGPQLVVPVKNARFALNAANARWGSLYDALMVPMRLVSMVAPGSRQTTTLFAAIKLSPSPNNS